MTLTRKEMQHDLELTRQDCLRLDGIVTNLRGFIRDCGEEDRTGFKMDLFKYETLWQQAGALRDKIELRLKQSDKNLKHLGRP